MITDTGTVLPLSINYNSAKELRLFLEERGMGMRKKYGQNFLIDPNVRSKLINALEIPGGLEVWEIGPGLGAMTGGLLDSGARVTAFEIDPAFVAALRELYGENPAFNLIEGDVFKTWPEAASGNVPKKGSELYLLGNLPYNIAAALLADFIEKGMLFKRMVVTVQREVALRMYAGPGSADYSSFSVLCASVYKVIPLLMIKSSCFYPAPRVDSQGVCLELLTEQEPLPRFLYPLVRCLFSARRKTLKNTLSAFAASDIIIKELSPGKGETRPNKRTCSAAAAKIAMEALKRTGISGDYRAEKLGIPEFAALASCLEEIVLNE